MATQFEWAKWIPGTHFLVDGFRHCTCECQNYFLTHAHSDHTTGLSKGWCAGTIHCTIVTARLLTEELGISREVVHAVHLDKPFTVEGVDIVAIDANHCPGSAMFLFSVPQKGCTPRHILHTGDFRFHPRMTATQALKSIKVHTLFLDTTYAGPRWTFPAQEAAVGMMVDMMKTLRKESPGNDAPHCSCSFFHHLRRLHAAAAAATATAATAGRWVLWWAGPPVQGSLDHSSHSVVNPQTAINASSVQGSHWGAIPAAKKVF